MSITLDSWIHEVKLEVTDIYWYRYRETRTLVGWILEEWNPSSTGSTSINATWTLTFPNTNPTLSPSISVTTPPPKITITRPGNGTMSVYKGDTSNLRFGIEVWPGVREVTVALNGNTIYSASSGENFVVPIETSTLEAWSYTLMVKVIDANVRSETRNISLIVLPK
jgi:hypothetical protein